MMLRNKSILIGVILLVIFASFFSYYFLFYGKKVIKQQGLVEDGKEQADSNFCFGGDEIAIYNVKEKEGNDGGVITIEIKNKLSDGLIYSFEIKNVRINYHPVELHQCNVYMVRMFGYDITKEGNQAPGYKEELWKYNYKGNGKPIILLSEKPKEFISYFSPDFRVDPLEHYIVLLKGYFGSPDYALVVKDLKTLEDAFVLPMTEIEKQNKEIIGNLELDIWTRDGRYFWAATHYGAVSLGFIRIDTQNWTSDIFQAPENVLGGDALNIENGFITVHPGNVWFGVEEIEQEEKAKRRKEGIGTELYIHNLFTGERSFVNKTDEPLWFFKPKWISENELEYELPTGEKKVYKINK